MTDVYASWIQQVHGALSPRAQDRVAAAWGSATIQHRTTRPEWFGAMDRAWARTVEVGRDVDVISAAVTDVPAWIGIPALRLGDLGPRGEVPIEPGSRTRMTWPAQGGRILGWDPESGKAVLLHARPPDEYELVSPMRNLVHWVLVAQGGLLVHAAAIGRAHASGVRGSLVLGNSGYGKSTTTLACVAQGWLTCGDDSVAVFPDECGWRAESIYAAIKTKVDRPAPVDMPPSGVTPLSWVIDGVKRAHLLTATTEQTLCSQMRLTSAILIEPEADPAAPVERATAARARTVSAPATVMPLPFDSEVVLKRLADLLSGVPVYTLPRRATLHETVADVTTIQTASQPGVSVVLPLYGGRRFVAEAIESILSQTVGRFQIVAVDDASLDDSLAVAESMRERIESAGHSLVAVELPHNHGIAGARNAGLAHADQPFVAWLDQDDLWPPDRTAVLLTAMHREGALMAAGRMTFQDVTPGSDRPWLRKEWFSEESHPGNVLGALICRRELLDQVGTLRDQFSSGFDDVDWLLRVRASGIPTTSSEHVTVIRRIHDQNQSRKASQAELVDVVRAHLRRKREDGK